MLAVQGLKRAFGKPHRTWVVDIATGLAIVALLVWAGRLMLHAETAEDIEAELPPEAELKGPSYGFQVQQVSEAEPADGSGTTDQGAGVAASDGDGAAPSGGAAVGKSAAGTTTGSAAGVPNDGD